jgi:hypothetical protein
MKTKSAAKNPCAVLIMTCVCLTSVPYVAGQNAAAKSSELPVVASEGPMAFATPEKAADAVIAAAKKFDVAGLVQIFGVGGEEIVLSGDFARDREHATDFAAQAEEKHSVSVDPKTGTRAFLLVGKEDWPFPVPMVKRGTKWYFDSKAGSQELLYRRIGANELDAIQICNGYVDAQYEYAMQPHDEYAVNQYAQRIIATPGTQDGLAWQDKDGTWGGPIGEKIAQAIEQGYTPKTDPYHGYFFKVLKGQGSAAPLGQLDYVIKDAMIGGFALVASPAVYGATGVKSFIVSQDGVVYEKDLGPQSLNEFQKMELFNPDQSWTPVQIPVQEQKEKST